MRFCMVTTFYPPYHIGGCATYVRALSRALVAQGHEVDVIHCIDAYRLKYKDEPPPEPADEGIVVHRLKSRFGALSPLISQQLGIPGLKSQAERAILARGPPPPSLCIRSTSTGCFARRIFSGRTTREPAIVRRALAAA